MRTDLLLSARSIALNGFESRWVQKFSSIVVLS